MAKLLMRAGVVALGFGALAFSPRLKAENPLRYALIDVHQIGEAGLAAAKKAIQPEWTIEADAELLVLAPERNLKKSPRPYRILDVVPNEQRLFRIRMAHADILPTLEADVLIRGGRQAIVQARTGYLAAQIDHPAIEPFEENAVLAKQAANAAALPHVAFSPLVTRAVRAVDGARWLRDVESLARLNRHTHGRQVLEARDYLMRAFQEIEGLEVSLQQFTVGSTQAFNVVAKWTGTSRPNDWYLVGGHYDSTSQSPGSAAPGAEDNGSGSAGVVEMARQIAAAKPAATVIFVVYSGEEQGLHGGYAHARKIVADGDKDKVKAVINMDMIGYTGDADLDCLLETDRRGSALFPMLQAAAAQYTRLRIVTSLNPWGSDHVPYIEQGMPSLLTIENDWDDYPAYHRTTDTAEKVSQAMGEETLKMNLATVLQMAGS